MPENNPEGNHWHFLAESGEGLRPRAAHSAVYVDITDSLYVFGGYDLNKVLGDLVVSALIKLIGFIVTLFCLGRFIIFKAAAGVIQMVLN